jgi:2-polyprenyl-3-methyl-5-hydroxy-6-metoxy-1,4-benzoquinol methylase
MEPELMSSKVNRLETPTLLREQVAYYRARAAEYDQWWLRHGRYDRGVELNAAWFAEAAAVKAALSSFRPAGRILELACGTGIWTEQLLPSASQITAVDASPEMLAINAARVRSPLVRYVQSDLFEWRPTDGEQYDVIFFGFWLSHVPPERFDSFWDLVSNWIAPGGRVFFVDSRYEHTSTAMDHTLPEPSAPVLERRLNDGRQFHIYKIFYDPLQLSARLGQLGWIVHVTQTQRYFIYGSGRYSGIAE